jgi:peroxin-2
MLIVFQELLSVTIPLINFHAMKRKIGGILKPTKAVQSQQFAEEPIINVNTKCAICLQRPSLPHHIKCVHVFCYFCLKSNVLADQNFQCPICDFSCKGDIFSVEINLK